MYRQKYGMQKKAGQKPLRESEQTVPWRCIIWIGALAEFVPRLLGLLSVFIVQKKKFTWKQMLTAWVYNFYCMFINRILVRKLWLRCKRNSQVSNNRKKQHISISKPYSLETFCLSVITHPHNSEMHFKFKI